MAMLFNGAGHIPGIGRKGSLRGMAIFNLNSLSDYSGCIAC